MTLHYHYICNCVTGLLGQWVTQLYYSPQYYCIFKLHMQKQPRFQQKNSYVYQTWISQKSGLNFKRYTQNCPIEVSRICGTLGAIVMATQNQDGWASGHQCHIQRDRQTELHTDSGLSIKNISRSWFSQRCLSAQTPAAAAAAGDAVAVVDDDNDYDDDDDDDVLAGAAGCHPLTFSSRYKHKHTHISTYWSVHCICHTQKTTKPKGYDHRWHVHSNLGAMPPKFVAGGHLA